MKHILIILLVIASLFVSCSTKPDVVQIDPIMEQEMEPEPEEYDRIISMCKGMFEHYGTGITTFCILRNFYALNHTERMYIEREVTADEFRDCHKEEFYFPEYETFWYGDVWDCLKGVTDDER